MLPALVSRLAWLGIATIAAQRRWNSNADCDPDRDPYRDVVQRYSKCDTQCDSDSQAHSGISRVAFHNFLPVKYEVPTLRKSRRVGHPSALLLHPAIRRRQRIRLWRFVADATHFREQVGHAHARERLE